MSFPSDLWSLYRDMELISSIPEQSKVNLNSFSYSSNNWRGNLYRYLNNENHEALIEKIKSIINKCIIYNQQYPTYRVETLKRLDKIKASLQRYRDVYEGRVDVIADLNILESDITHLHKEMKRN